MRFCWKFLPIVFGVAGMIGAAKAHADDDLPRAAAAILQQHCLKCHNDRDRAGGLSMTNIDSLTAGGNSGAAIDPGDVDGSYLIDMVTPENGRAAMPPEGPPLSKEDIATLRRWIRAGAQWPQGLALVPPTQSDPNWWSLRPLVKPPIPEVDLTGADVAIWGRNVNPIDRFVLEQLQAAGLSFSPEAERRVLARRLYFDLIGLPSTPEELDQFAADPDPAAYERLVDQLLDSPRYGERWARHWLDVVHYADTHGFDKDKPRPNAWPYRDYVIRSLNEGKPWRRFIEEQVAGDVLYPGTIDGIEALGFLAAGPWDFVGHEEVPESKIDGKLARHLDRDDMVRNTIQSFTSLTIGCAQCHHHKFDPIAQREYYALQSVFAALDRADKPYFADPNLMDRWETLRARQVELEQSLDTLQRMYDRQGGLTRVLLDPRIGQYAIFGCATRLTVESNANKHLLTQLPPPRYVYSGTVHHGLGSFCGTGPLGGRPREIRILNRGDVTQPGELATPGALSLVAGLDSEFHLPPDHDEGDRRAALARWLSSPANNYTWRSIVNRVWQHHFGVGIVDTPNDFGQMGGQPSHPKLLDWLACEFRDGDQSLKGLHRWIVTSRTYRQASTVDPSSPRVQRAQSVDAENRLLWRAPRRKLDAESVRDSILLLSRKLDLTMGGPGFHEFVIEKPEHSPHYRYDLHDFENPAAHRRSVYRFTVRSQLQPFMNALDCADPSQQVARRNESQSPLQALAILNNGLVLTMSEHYAAHLLKAVETSPHKSGNGSMRLYVARGFLEVTGRHATKEELDALTEYVDRHGLANVCRVLFNLNEFLFVD